MKKKRVVLTYRTTQKRELDKALFKINEYYPDDKLSMNDLVEAAVENYLQLIK